MSQKQSSGSDNRDGRNEIPQLHIVDDRRYGSRDDSAARTQPAMQSDSSPRRQAQSSSNAQTAGSANRPAQSRSNRQNAGSVSRRAASSKAQGSSQSDASRVASGRAVSGSRASSQSFMSSSVDARSSRDAELYARMAESRKQNTVQERAAATDAGQGAERHVGQRVRQKAEHNAVQDADNVYHGYEHQVYRYVNAEDHSSDAVMQPNPKAKQQPKSKAEQQPNPKVGRLEQQSDGLHLVADDEESGGNSVPESVPFTEEEQRLYDEAHAPFKDRMKNGIADAWLPIVCIAVVVIAIVLNVLMSYSNAILTVLAIGAGVLLLGSLIYITYEDQRKANMLADEAEMILAAKDRIAERSKNKEDESKK